MKNVGILTGGGDCPGLNPVIRAVVRKALSAGYRTIGIKNGWRGMIEGESLVLDEGSISGILPRGGTILGTSRTNPFNNEGDLEKLVKNFSALELDALVPIGGEDTLGVAAKLFRDKNLPIVGVPKTIDNDLYGTDFTFGFFTAVDIAMECIDRLHTTAESHNRIIVVEVMGRHAGWIAAYAGLAGGADMILIPEKPIEIDKVCQSLQRRHNKGKNFSIVVVAEGAKFQEGCTVIQQEELDAFGHVKLGGIGQMLAQKIEQITGFETRVAVLGHIQRGGSPSAYDRILGTRYGIKAMELVIAGKFGKVVALQGNKIVDIQIESVLGKIKTVDDDIYKIASTFFE